MQWLAVPIVIAWLAFMFGFLGQKIYVIGSIFWLFSVIIHWNVRKAAPHTPEFGIFLGWFILGVFGVGLVVAALTDAKW